MAVLFTSALSGTKANLVGEYTINYQDVANNKTNVTATLSIVSTGYYLSGSSTIFFNGSQYNQYINIPQWGRQVVATQTYDINHNPDGTGSISISGSCNVANGSFQASGSGGAGLPTIPRASQPSLVTFPNTTDNIFIGDRITIHFNRKSTSFTHKIQLLFDGYNPYLVENQIGGDNWVWDTSKNATEIYKKMPTVNRKQGTIRLYTYNGGTLIGSKDVNFTANIKDANPIFTNFEYEIIDDKSISLTGNNKTAIKSFSNVKAIVSNINKAQAQKEATIIKYKFVCGNKQIEVPYNDDTEMLLEQIDNITMNVYAIDSRGNSTMVGKTFDNFIEYENIRITELNANRLNGVDTQTNLSYKGNYWGKSFGEVSNTIKSVKYEYKETDGTEWVLGETDITPKTGMVNKTASGTEITVEDSLSFPLNSIKIDGKTVQNGTPTPDNPIEIKNVKGYSNLFNKDGTDIYEAFINGSNKTIVGLANTKTAYVKCKPNTSYYVSKIKSTKFIVGTTTEKPVIGMVCNKITTNNEAEFIKIRTGESDNYLVVFYYNGRSDTLSEQEIRESIQIIEGNEEKPYIPYRSNFLQMNSNCKNLFNIDTLLDNEITMTRGTIEKSVNSKSITLKSTGNDCYINNTYHMSKKPTQPQINGVDKYGITVLPNTKYTWSFEITNLTGTGSQYMFFYDENYVFLYLKGIGVNKNGRTNITVETEPNVKYVCFRFGLDKAQYTLTVSNVQFEKGDNVTEYNSYQSNSIFLNLKDNELAENDFVKIVDNYGTIYTATKIRELVGTENWSTNGNGDFYCQDFAQETKGSGKILSTHFKSAMSWAEDSIFISAKGNLGLTIRSIQTVEEFKQWLANQKENGTPVIVQYELKTPYTVDLGMQDNLDTYEGTTVISLEDELNPNMEINYVAKGEEGIGLGKFDFSGLIKGDLEALGFTLDKSFNIKVTISDELSTFSLETILNTGTPNLAIAKSGISIGSKYDESVGGKVQGIYEIGDLFISTKNENPSIRFGGTWEQIKDVFLLACGDKYKAGAKGGSDKHTLTKAEIPHLGSGVKYGGNTIAGGSGWSDSWLGGGDTAQSFSIMPPYLAVYVWVRTA